jgi:hypothetical protein
MRFVYLASVCTYGTDNAARWLRCGIVRQKFFSEGDNTPLA